MKKLSLLVVMLLGIVVVIPTVSYAYEVVKDTYYFLRDDGEFSDEEKDEEAEYIYTQCMRNIMQRSYFNCQCIAGAFRLKRDSDEKIRPQSDILNDIFNGEKNSCVDKPKIAGLQYGFCSNYAENLRSRSKNNEEYCGCVGNTVALQFANKPLLKTHYVERLRTNALVACNKRK